MSAKKLPHVHNHALEAKLETLPGAEEFAAVSGVFKQLSDSSRVRIFWILCHGEECVINLSAMVEMSSPAVSHHLKQLKASGLVCSRREGKEVYYTAAKTPETELLHLMIERIMEITCPLGGKET